MEWAGGRMWRRGTVVHRSFDHGVVLEFGLGWLQRPRGVLNFAARDAAASVGGVETVALGQEIFECAGLGVEDVSGWAKAHPQICVWGAAMRAFAAVLDPAGAIFATHARVEIGEMKPGARDRDRDCVGGVETEEPDTGFPAVRYVGTDIEFGESGKRRECGCHAKTHTGHAEGDDTDPGFVLERVDFERCRNQRTQCCAQLGGGDWPMREEQIVPCLRHSPWAGGHRPWAMCNLGQRAMHRVISVGWDLFAWWAFGWLGLLRKSGDGAPHSILSATWTTSSRALRGS